MLVSTARIDGPGLAARVAPRVDRPLTRFAPAPTGRLHMGHVVNAILVWGLARALGGRVLLRIEDHDRQRASARFEGGILDDLDWLGLVPDVFPTSAFRAGACASRQSERDAIYRAALEPLIARGLVYGCDCSRRRLTTLGEDRAAPAPAPASPGDPPERRYPGLCRGRGLPLTDGVGWRVRLEDTAVVVDDGLAGRVRQVPAEQCGDVLVRDRLGNWTYQWAVSVDDWRQDVALVVRGEDLLPSTGRQVLLAALAGREAPARFVHHPVLMKSATQKLSKSDGDTGVVDLRAAGWSPSRVLGEAAALVGLLPAPDAIGAGDLAALFALSAGRGVPLS